MATISVFVTDATGGRRDEVEMPDDQPNIRVIAALVQTLGLPLVGPDGQPMSYRFHHTETQSQLRDDSTLSQSGVNSGDTLRLVPEITAG
jgi:hypothetical protein|tara:strand:- start:348 stop:617 length:270 start_codon:yes stop_codon:yes gene_type:complete